jgi:uncharacterized membrane protein YhaH (DUF805 family)
MADVFISYAREDRPHAERIAHGLSAMGLEPFWDTEIPPGQTWSDYIEGKLAACKAVIVLWSAHSTKSQWVREEARMGRDKGRLIPVMLDASTPPFGFGEVQAADLSAWNGEANHPAWTRLSGAVYSTVRGADAAPPAPQAQAAWSAPPPPTSGWSSAQPHPAPHAPGGAAEALSPVGYIQKCLRLFANGAGRARRAEYWWWTLFAIVVSIVAYVLDIAVGGMNQFTGTPNSQIITGIAGLALLAPGISVASRRFHDVGLSGWLAGAAFAVYVLGYGLAASAMPIGSLLLLAAGIVVLVVAVMPSKPGENQYGPNPKGV